MIERTFTPIRTALVGFGGVARGVHTMLLTSLPEYAVTAAVARSDRSASAAASALPGATLHRSLADLLAATGTIDLAIVTTADDAHVEVGLALLEAGVPTVIDKPLAPTSAGAVRLQDAARAAGVPVIAFQNKRWDADFSTIAQAVRSGTIGEVLRYEAWIVRWSPGIWDNWREVARPGTLDGPVADIGSHMVDQAVALLGPVASVSAELGRHRPGTQVVDDAFLALTHDSGVRSHLHFGALTSSPTPQFVIQGSEGSIVSTGEDGQFAASFQGIGPNDPRWRSFDTWHAAVHRGGSLWPVPIAGEVIPLEPVRSDARDFYRLLAAHLAGTGPAPVDPAETLHVLLVLEAAVASAAAGAPVDVVGVSA